MKKELKELKEKMRNCDLTQFENYNDYIKYTQKLALEFMKKNKDLTIEELDELLKK